MGLQSAVPAGLVLLLQRVLDRGLIERDPQVLLSVPLGLVALYALQGGADFARGMITRRVSWAVITALRNDVMRALLRQELQFHLQHSPAALATRVNNDVESVQYAVSAVVSAVQRPLTVLGLLLAAARMEPGLTALAALGLPVLLVPVGALQRRLRAAARARNDQLGALNAAAVELLGGVRTVQDNGAEAIAAERFAAHSAAQQERELAAHAARLLPGPVVELSTALGIAALIGVGGQRVLAGAMEPGALVAFLVALGLLVKPLKGLVEVSSLMSRALAGAEAVYALIDRQPAGVEAGDGPVGPRPSLRARGLCFAYGDKIVLQDVDLDLSPGRRVGLVGPSGAGKTTLLRLLMRHLEPTAGALLIDGAPAASRSLRAFRARAAVVAADDLLLDADVATNLRLGRPEATEAELQAAALATGAADFIAALPEGWATRLGHAGCRLSAGQRQRLFLARALVKDAGLLLLDEPTSHLDAESEAALQRVIDHLSVERAVLQVSHRLHTLQGCDELIVLEAGRVVERGRHAALLAQGGVYAALWRSGTAAEPRPPTPSPTGAPDEPD